MIPNLMKTVKSVPYKNRVIFYIKYDFIRDSNNAELYIFLESSHSLSLLFATFVLDWKTQLQHLFPIPVIQIWDSRYFTISL